MFLGSGRDSTIITANRSVAGGTTTFNSATVAAVGAGFLARDITFQNTAGPSGHKRWHYESGQISLHSIDAA
ncbi:hypothetical protein L1987_70485 [Smallanthus sonchifolius]|uniref:Uncharacterized protein n=1 Tax=Smallanthus sonchifolius TaxID=185202 RepID=A0ACB9APQ2_9ASTR|nr:hypothetical protein L1987_70485 [Smallanthus sonchifolius]